MARCLRSGTAVEEPDQLVGAQDDGELLRLLGTDDVLDDPILAQGDAVEELQGAAGLVVVAPGERAAPGPGGGGTRGPAQARGARARCRSTGRKWRRTRRRSGWSAGARLRRFMSSIMRRRSGVMASSF